MLIALQPQLRRARAVVLPALPRALLPQLVAVVEELPLGLPPELGEVGEVGEVGAEAQHPAKNSALHKKNARRTASSKLEPARGRGAPVAA